MGMIVSCLSNVMYMSEKLALWLTCIGLISTLVLTFVLSLGMGIGLGYNYCFVDLKTKYKYIPAHYIYNNSPRWPYKHARMNEPDLTDPDEREDDYLRNPPEVPPEFKKEPISIPINEAPYNESRLWMDESLRSANDTNPWINETIPPPNKTMPEEETTAESLLEFSTESTTESEATDETTELNEYVPYTTFSKIELRTESLQMYDENGDPTPSRELEGSDTSGRRVKKLVIPISGVDLISLLSKLKAENKNYSLQLITT